ncbi:MAG: hypothetical protein MUC34_16720 [Anaerolineae bacterium]|nr:hypothetical protein [Anaerolineae bacterium]
MRLQSIGYLEVFRRASQRNENWRCASGLRADGQGGEEDGRDQDADRVHTAEQGDEDAAEAVIA